MLIQKLKPDERIYVRGEGFIQNISPRAVRLSYEGPITVLRAPPEVPTPKPT
jgi:hypothetical protein